MSRQVVTVAPEASPDEIHALFETHGVRRLPVVREHRLLGIVTRGDLRAAERAPDRAGMSAEVLMTGNVITVGPGMTVEQAGTLMVDNKIGALPVLDDDDELVGIITESDVLNVFLDAMGVGSGAARLELILPDRPGMLATVAQTLARLDVNIVSLLSTPAEDGSAALVFRITTDDLERVLNELSDLDVEVLSAEEGSA